MSTAAAPLGYRVGEIEVDVGRAILRRGGLPVHLTPKAYQILLHLLVNRERLVSRDELMDLCWKDTAVTDDALAQCIAEMRRAMGDSSRNPLYLKTVPKMGYRFVAQVEEMWPVVAVVKEEVTTIVVQEEFTGDVPSRRIAAPQSKLRFVWPVAGLMVALVAVGWYVSHRPIPQPPGTAGKRQVAVLRFENRSGDADLDWLRDGLPDMLTTTLSRSRSLEVLSREQIALWVGRIGANGLPGALEVAQRGHAQVAIVGSFSRLGAATRVDVQIYDGKTGALIAAESATSDKPEQMLTQIDVLGSRIAAHIDPKPANKNGNALASLMTDNLEAYRYYTLGLQNAESYQTEEAIRFFRKAVELDPNFAMAYARIGNAYTRGGSRLTKESPTWKRRSEWPVD